MNADPKPARCLDHVRRAAGCAPCRAYHRWYFRMRQRAIRSGRWQHRQDAAPLRAHLAALLTFRGAISAAAQATGVSDPTVRDILAGRVVKVSPDTAAALYALTPAILGRHLDPLYGVRVDAAGTRRRLQGLMVDGWPVRDLAGQLDRAASVVRAWTRAECVSPVTAARVKRLATRLAGVRGPSPVTARRARTAGYVSLLAWDDIDNPAAAPQLDELAAARARRQTDLDSLHVDLAAAGEFTHGQLTRAERVAAVRALAGRLTARQIAVHLRWPGPDEQAAADALARFASRHRITLAAELARAA